MSADDLSLEAIGFAPFFAAQLDALDGGRVPARIAIAHGESYVSWTADGVRKAVISGRRLETWQNPIDRPQVGDWVTGTYSDSAGALVIEHLLERRTCLVRRAAGERAEAQVIASNVDVVGIVSSFESGKDKARDRRLINQDRLARYLTAVQQSRAAPVLILNKSDLSPQPQDTANELARLFPGIPVVLVSCQAADGIAPLRPWMRPGQTLGFVGMSGVGKSTLVNTLLGRTAQQVGEVRAADARGRHTTTHRELFTTPSGALLLDTPGMRELGLWNVEEVVNFNDVVAVAAACRFTNCRHASEPGCAIRAAIASGELSEERWISYGRQQQKLFAANESARATSEAHLRGRRGRRRP